MDSVKNHRLSHHMHTNSSTQLRWVLQNPKNKNERAKSLRSVHKNNNNNKIKIKAR